MALNLYLHTHLHTQIHTYSLFQLLKRNNLTLKDIDVIEFHEAFAGQVRTTTIHMKYIVECS